MTIADVVNQVDQLKPNQYTTEQKVGWIAQLEDQIYSEIVSTHDNPMRISRPNISYDSDPDTVLIAPKPYDEVYQLYLQCQIDLGNMEIGKYNNDRTLYNNALMTFRDYWNRTYMPCEKVPSFSFDDRRRNQNHGHNFGLPEYIVQGNPLDLPQHKRPIMPVEIKRKPMNKMKIHDPMLLPEKPMKSVEEEIIENKGVNRKQQKQINELLSRRPEEDEALSAAEVGEIIG